MRKNNWWNGLTMRARALVLAGGMIISALLVSLGVKTNSTGQMIAGCVIVVGFLAAHIFLIRCPHCGAYLGRDVGRYCRCCGKNVDEPEN